MEEIARPKVEASVLTFLIADVRGYTKFTQERGDAAAAKLAKRFADLAREATEARGGKVIELRGDEALAVFRSTDQAVRAAVEFQATCSEESENDPEYPLPVGIGIDVGAAEPVEDGYRGVALNMAARLCSQASAGEVLTTTNVVEGSGIDADEVRFERKGPVSLKGFSQPVEVVQAVSAADRMHGARPARSQEERLPLEFDVATPLVDREHEMHWLFGTWRSVRRGRGRLLFLSGDAQIGKTRLAAEFGTRVFEDGGRVVYAGPGGAATAIALRAIDDATKSSEPTLLVVDDGDFAGPEVATALAGALDEIPNKPVLILTLLRDAAGDRAFSSLVERADLRGDAHAKLGPFDLDRVRDVVRLYAGENVADAPIESMERSSGGIPGRIHEVASEWARSEAGRRLEAAAEFLTAGRDKRAGDLEFANNVIQLKLGRLYTVDGRDAPVVGLSEGECPYKGLASFEQEDSASFFGRERLVGELAARAVGVGLLGVVGASGSGKSSVVAAGLLPSLRAGLLPGSERWSQATMRPGEHPMDALRAALEDLAPELSVADDPLRALATGGKVSERLVLVIDQFEETFTMCDADAERQKFLESIAVAALEAPERVVVIPTLRSDLYGHAAPYESFAALLSANHVLVAPMTRDELRRTVELPARRAGLRVEQALVDALVEEVADEPGGLPLLSTAMVELWAARDNGWIRFEAYERSGGVRGAVARLAESSYLELDDAQQEAAHRVFLRLVAVEGETVARRRVSLDEFDLDRDPAARAAIDRLVRDRLLTAGENAVEVAHEALLREWPRLETWLQEDMQGRQLRQQLIQSSQQWAEGGREPSQLYRGARLSMTLDWAATRAQELNAVEQDFLAESRQASERDAEKQRRTNRRLRGLLVAGAVFLVVALGAGVLAFIQRGNARKSAHQAVESARVALSQSLGAQAVSEPRLDRALLLARQATAVDDSVRTRSNLLTTLLKAPRVTGVFYGTDGRINGLAISPDGRRLAIADNGDPVNVIVTNTATGRRIGKITSEWPDVGLGPDGSVLRPVFHNGLPTGIDAVDPETGEVVGHYLVPKSVANKQAATTEVQQQIVPGGLRKQTFDYDPETGRLAASFVIDLGPETPYPERLPGIIMQWDYETRKPVVPPIFVPHSNLLSIEYADGVERIVAVGTNTYVYRADTGRLIKSFPGGGFSGAVSPDGTHAAFGGDGGVVKTLDLKTGEVKEGSNQHDAGVTAVDYAADGTLISSSDDGTTFLWDEPSHELRERLGGHAGNVHSQAVSPDGSTVYTGGFDTTAMAYDLTGRQSFVQTFQAADTDENFGAFTLAVSPDSKTMAIGDTFGRVHLWDLETLEKIDTFQVEEGTLVAAVSFAPDGRSLLVAVDKPDPAAPEGQLMIWDIAGEPSLVGEMEPAIDGYSWATLSPDGTTVAAGGHDADQDFLRRGKVAEWDAATGKLLAKPIEIKGGSPIYVAFAHEGTTIALGGSNGVVAVADPAHSEMIRKWKISSEFINGVAFSPDNNVLATADDAGFVKLWKWQAEGSGKPPKTRSKIHASEVGVSSVTWSPDGTYLATAGGETMRLYDPATGRQIGSSVPVSVWFPLVAFTPDGEKLVSADADGRAWVMPVSVDQWEERACQIANRNFTPDEWDEFVTGRSYEKVCTG